RADGEARLTGLRSEWATRGDGRSPADVGDDVDLDPHTRYLPHPGADGRPNGIRLRKPLGVDVVETSELRLVRQMNGPLHDVRKGSAAGCENGLQVVDRKCRLLFDGVTGDRSTHRVDRPTPAHVDEVSSPDALRVTAYRGRGLVRLDTLLGHVLL